MLTQPYRLTGTVEAGAARGRLIGFPTANLGQVATIVPAPGIYGGWAWPEAGAGASRRVPAAIHIGTSPTFGDTTPRIEVHLIDWQGDLYGQQLAVDFLLRIRDIRQFPSADQLVDQMRDDVAAAREFCRQAD
jgi:riboflavin kinase/FMN adenylyltransferase